ncbi:MAG: TVP38/TMEM64 family protein [Nitrospiraceae bacterium]|nr:TVP38/TMEM64 family protein [Nitrospiraceae bacterium]
MKKNAAAKAAFALLIAAVIAAFEFLHLGDYFTLSYIKASREEFASLYAGHAGLVIAGYAAGYILVTSLSLPGAAVMTLAGGALFGLVTGTIVVSFASTIGATLACVVSRFLLRDWVQKKFGGRIAKINEGIEKEGAFYLFTLRLIPVFPFWLINLAMGLTGMRLITFYWVSQIGMLAGTAVYVNAGKELGKIDSLRGIISPRLLGSFALLGIFPIAAKKIVGWCRSRTDKRMAGE